jgi:5'-3' exonuclease
MKLGNHTLLIDGNYFIHSRLFVLPKPKSGPLLGDDNSKGQFIRKLAIDFASEVRKMTPFVNQIVFAVDSKSWRKDLFPEAQYKGTRTQDNSVDWSAVYEVYDEFKLILAKKGVIVNQVKGAEADDILFAWSTYLNSQGKNCIIWTGDRDMIQLVDYSKATDGYSLWYYNTKRKLIAFEGFNSLLIPTEEIEMDNDDLLFNMDSPIHEHGRVKGEMIEYIKKNQIEIEEINCDRFVFQKILMGDKSDNIKSVVTYQKPMKTGKSRTFSITDKQAENVLEQYIKEEGDFVIDHMFNSTQVEKIVDLIYRIIGHDSKTSILNRFNQNLDLMLLHYNTIPDPIQKEIMKVIDRDKAVEPMIMNLSQMEKILEGSSWMKKANTTPVDFDAFAGLDESETKSTEASKTINNLF